MKFAIERDTLKSALECATKGMDMNSTLPILSGVLITATDDASLTLETTNMEVSIRQKVVANVEEPGQVVVPCKLLSDIIGHLPPSAVLFDLDGSMLHIGCGKSSYNLNTMSAQDFPQFPSYDIESMVELPCDTLSAMAGRVAVAASNDKNRSILNGVLVSVTSDLVRFVTTDSVRLAVAEAAVTSGVQNFEVIAPAKTLSTVLSLAGGQKSITIGTNATQIVFLFGDVVYVTRRIEGTYPNYRKLIPASHATHIEMKTNDLYEAMQRIKAMTANNSEIRLQISPEAGVLVITSNLPDQGNAREEIQVTGEGEEQVIAFNSRFIYDCVKKGDDGDTVSFEMENPNRPGIFRTLGKIDFLYLVMPVRTSY
jgi:DNA polymerase-3 subunit beta